MLHRQYILSSATRNVPGSAPMFSNPATCSTPRKLALEAATAECLFCNQRVIVVQFVRSSYASGTPFPRRQNFSSRQLPRCSLTQRDTPPRRRPLGSTAPCSASRLTGTFRMLLVGKALLKELILFHFSTCALQLRPASSTS